MATVVGTTCTLYYDYVGCWPPDEGDYARSSGGSLYEVLESRKSPTILKRYYLKVRRCAKDTDTGRARVLPLQWYKR